MSKYEQIEYRPYKDDEYFYMQRGSNISIVFILQFLMNQ